MFNKKKEDKMDTFKNTLDAITRSSQSSSLHAKYQLVLELLIDLTNRRKDLEDQIKKLDEVGREKELGIPQRAEDMTR